MRPTLLLALLVPLWAPALLTGQEPADTRDYWVYEGGWFGRLPRSGWYEMNEETHRLGKPWTFREVRRTKEYVELRDEGRAVTIRLTETDLEVRWDKDGPDAEWKRLVKGRWKQRG